MKDYLKKKRIGSLTQEMMVIIIALVTGTVFLCWFLNNAFLEKYYISNKEKTMLESYQVIDNAAQNGKLETDDFDVAFENLCSNCNITALVIGPDRTVIRSSANDTQGIMMQFMDLLFGNQDDEIETLQRSDNYVLQRQNDDRLESEYLVLWGTLSDGNFIMMRTALESIRESVTISNRFLGYVGVIGVLISAVVIIFVSRGITTPILELTNISKRMTELDFDAKYSVRPRHRNEIDELGVHINQLSETLERTISELKSANNELQKDIEKKNEIDEMRKEFLSNVSHELKTPLALIQGYAEGLKECINDDAESRDFYCEVIMDESDKMNRMVKKLLTLNQLEFGNQALTMERFDLTELIRGVTESSSILLMQNEITLNFLENEPIYVWADEFQIEEVITNYLSNAIHHAAGKKEITISCTRKPDCVRVHVFNTGEPIPEADIENIWIKFYKVDKARTREYGGSGIGLSIVKAIMDAHHHACGAVNHEDGVEFWLELDTNANEG